MLGEGIVRFGWDSVITNFYNYRDHWEDNMSTRLKIWSKEELLSKLDPKLRVSVRYICLICMFLLKTAYGYGKRVFVRIEVRGLCSLYIPVPCTMWTRV